MQDNTERAPLLISLLKDTFVPSMTYLTAREDQVFDKAMCSGTNTGRSARPIRSDILKQAVLILSDWSGTL